jgi:hypothetical protein
VRWLAGLRIERFDPYSHIEETDPLLLSHRPGADCHGRYDVDGQQGLEMTLARRCAEELAAIGEDESSDGEKAVWGYIPARALCGDSSGSDSDSGSGAELATERNFLRPTDGHGCVGPQDLEERVHVDFTRPTDGLGFCAAWCFFLAECRILNPDVPSSALVSRVLYPTNQLWHANFTYIAFTYTWYGTGCRPARKTAGSGMV